MSVNLRSSACATRRTHADASHLDWSCSFDPKEGVPEEQAVTFVDSFYGALVTAIKDAVEAED